MRNVHKKRVKRIRIGTTFMRKSFTILSGKAILVHQHKSIPKGFLLSSSWIRLILTCTNVSKTMWLEMAVFLWKMTMVNFICNRRINLLSRRLKISIKKWWNSLNLSIKLLMESSKLMIMMIKEKFITGQDWVWILLMGKDCLNSYPLKKTKNFKIILIRPKSNLPKWYKSKLRNKNKNLILKMPVMTKFNLTKINKKYLPKPIESSILFVTLNWNNKLMR